MSRSKHASIAPVPAARMRVLVDAPVQRDGDYVLYWMTAARRPTSNFALQRAIEHATELGKPLVVFEALRAGYRWASARHHRFVLDGMAANERAFAERSVLYFPYVEPEPGAGRGLLAALAESACAVVADDWPCFFLPHMLARAAELVRVRCEAVDSVGLLPFRDGAETFPSAYAFRRSLQKRLPAHLAHVPRADPFDGVQLASPSALPAALLKRWPRASAALLAGDARELAQLPIDAAVGVAPRTGGHVVARAALADFVRLRLARYADERSEPTSDASSGLSPWLHYGHVGAHEVFAAVCAREGWTLAELGTRTDGKKQGFWGLGASAEAFLDEFITWRELGFNFCARRDDYDQYASLPAWARATLAEHTSDPREHVYSRAELEESRTHDPLWNAAQRQLVREGVIHNYLRMLWGKKVLQWSRTPEDALATLVELNNRWALDGRDPNSYSGIFWCFGRYDRPWGPERKVFGTIRYMTSENTARKLDVAPYLARYAETSARPANTTLFGDSDAPTAPRSRARRTARPG
jgi:deoxyribodipyrimidine photo-lyase